MCAKLMGLVFGVLAVFLLSGLAQAATIECDSCDDCNSKIAAGVAGDIFLLNASFSTTSSCITINGILDIVFDCQGNTVWGNNDGGIAALYIANTGNVTVRNCNFYGFDGGGLTIDTTGFITVEDSGFRFGNNTLAGGGTGFGLLASINGTFRNLDLSDNAFGFGMAYGSNDNVFENITANRNIYGDGFNLNIGSMFNHFSDITAIGNAGNGILFMSGANFNIIEGVNLSGNGIYGIYVLNSNGNTVFRFRDEWNGAAGIYIDDGESNGNLFYDGIFNNTVNYVSVNSSNVNFWNVAVHGGLNILECCLVGGNFWSGYSEACVATMKEGICDSPLVLDASNVDSLPLSDGVCYEDGGIAYALTLDYPPYAAVGDTVAIHAYFLENGTPDNCADVNITIDMMTVTMTWDNVSGSYLALWVPSVNGDYPINVSAWHYPFFMDVEGLIRVRTPFNITVRLWNNINMTAGSEYRNEFAWIYLTRDLDPTLHVLFGRDKFTCPPEGVDECYWHGKYVNGTAVITLYETGNYTMYILGNNIEWYLVNPSGVSMPCAFCPPVKTQSRFLLNLGNYYLDKAEDFDLYYSQTELYYLGGFFGMFASWLNLGLFIVIGFIFFIIVLLATGSLKSAIAVLVILPSILWLISHLILW